MGDGPSAFHDAYEMFDKLGCGVQGCTWKVTKKGGDGTVYVAKIYKTA
jgi:hypothetical protein